MRLTVHAHKIHIKQARERLLDKIALILAHQALIDKDACQLLSDRTAQQCRRDGRIHTAGQSQNHLLVPDLRTQLFDGIADKIIHHPVAGEAADTEQEIAQDILAVDAVRDLRMELHRVNLLLRTLERRARAVRRFRGDGKALRQLADKIGMAHPDRAACRNTVKEDAFCMRHGDFAVFGFLACGDLAAQRIRDKLTAVADAENRDAERENLAADMR